MTTRDDYLRRLKPGTLLRPALSPELGLCLVVSCKVFDYAGSWCLIDALLLTPRQVRLITVGQQADNFFASWHVVC